MHWFLGLWSRFLDIVTHHKHNDNDFNKWLTGNSYSPDTDDSDPDDYDNYTGLGRPYRNSNAYGQFMYGETQSGKDDWMPESEFKQQDGHPLLFGIVIILIIVGVTLAYLYFNGQL